MKQYRVKPGQEVKLKDFDPSETGEFKGGKAEGLLAIGELIRKLEPLQELLYAEHLHKVLIVLQAMDTAGKDGTIRRVFEGVNPQGVSVAAFKIPTPFEMDHDYLWRVHQVVPAKGQLTIFNRSHYEDVLAVRVHQLITTEECKARYKQINAFERMLAEEGTTILKFYLHISPGEQKKRLLARLEDETKQWKYNPGDLKERQLWKQYMQAYEDVLRNTSTDYAPWYLVPSDRKWYRDWVVATTLVETLRDLKMKYPRPAFDVDATIRDFDTLAGDAGAAGTMESPP
jgi:PPK2 family polyphosphate:nucleotide phosphotransferase